LNLIERKIQTTELLKGNFLNVVVDQVVLPDGHFASREYIVHPGASMIVPFLINKEGALEVVLERQYRHPIGRVMIEFPAGKLDAGETCFECACRELREETGYTATQWAHAGVLHPVISYSTEFIDIWFAKNLTLSSCHLDNDEFLEVFSVLPEQFFAWCRDGLITDGKTLAAALWLQNVMSGAWTLNWFKH
jgi:ADP-ribose pyrophosphatase